jgi:hypothetical protein
MFFALQYLLCWWMFDNYRQTIKSFTIKSSIEKKFLVGDLK